MPSQRSNYILCKEPYSVDVMRYEQTQGEPLQLTEFSQLNGKRGYVFAPFRPSARTPILLIQPDKVEKLPMRAANEERKRCEVVEENHQREAYHRDFARFHAALTDGRFRKLVLGRSATIQLSATIDAEELFWQACCQYPRMYVALVSTEMAGTWLMATPEVLLRREGKRCATMSLAGTMKLNAEQHGFDSPPGQKNDIQPIWSHKNLEEQHIVTTYIRSCLENFSSYIDESETTTQRAGNLVHLRSDFVFGLKEGKDVGDVVKALFPTPAVCGMPKEHAWRFIVEEESGDRAYYSGVAGAMMTENDVQLYVTLRCMHIEENRLRLYAGGGLLPDSDEEQEWNETMAKMETMKNLLNV